MIGLMHGLMAGSAAPVPLPTYRYWRIYITANNGDAYNSIQEIELRGSIGGADLTTPDTPSSQSSYYANNDARAYRAIDNDLTDPSFKTWVSDGSALPQWIYFDLGVATPVAELVMWCQAYSGGPARAPKDFLIEGGSDSVNWTPVASIVGQTGWVVGTPRSFALT